jgi:hypothetical protein
MNGHQLKPIAGIKIDLCPQSGYSLMELGKVWKR